MTIIQEIARLKPDATSSVERPGERGVALVLSLFLVTIMSVLAASLMFLSQTETYATMNYRMMSQARYGAESGVHAAANYLLNGYVAVEPGSVTDPLASYNTNVSPVLCVAGCPNVGQPVVLSAATGVASNYPVATTETAFNNAAKGTLAAGTTTVNYSASAMLMSMQVVGTGIVQTWQITADGSINGARTATVEVNSTLDAQIIPGVGYAAFATGDGCGSISFSGSSTTDSYDSSTYVAGAGALSAGNGGLSNTGSNVGTNGNLTDSGNATINGNLYTPRTGVGACHNGGGGVAGDAQTESGHADLTGTVIQLPADVVMPTPALPSPLPPTTSATINAAANCATIGLTSPTCTGAAGVLVIDLTLSTVSLGNITLSGGASVTIKGTPGTPGPGAASNLAINSITLTGNSTVTVFPGTYVVMDVAGKVPGTPPTDLANPIDFTGGAVANLSKLDPSALQIQYAGTGSVSLGGTSATAAVLDAPNASVSLSGNNDFYGSIISASLVNSGNGTVHYDRHLTKSMYSTNGAPWLTTFTWKKY